MVIGEQLQQQQQQQQVQHQVVVPTHRQNTTQQQLQQQQSQQQSQHQRRNSTHNLPRQVGAGINTTGGINTSNNNNITNSSSISCGNSNNNNNTISSISSVCIGGVGGGNSLTNTPNNNNNAGNNSSGVVGIIGGGTSTIAAKNQLEQLNTMREALFSQDGWGCQHVNQDTNWEVPSSPEPSNKDSPGGPPLWKPTINNGTDLWESNLRNGGQPPTQTVAKTPWGHTPSSNLGGTWGEDDDGAESSSVWAGAAGNSGGVGGGGGGGGAAANVAGVSSGGVQGSGGGNGPQWGQGGVGAVGVGVGTGGNTAGVPGGVAGGNGPNAAGVNAPGAGPGGPGGAGVGNAGNGWGDPRELRSGPMGGGPMDMRGVDPRDPMRAASAGDPRDLRMLDPRDPIRGDPRGISGRLNGTSEMWQHHPIAHNQMSGMNKMVGPSSNVTSTVVGGGVGGIGGPGVNTMNAAAAGGITANVGSQWGAATQSVVGPKDITAIAGKQVTGWEEPSPPPQRRNIPNYDDGTSLWGQQTRVPGSGAHWKDIPDPMNRNHLMRNAMGGQNTSNVGLVGSVVSNSSGIGGGQTPGGNPNAPLQVRLGATMAPGGGVGVGVGGQHKSDNTMWVHPSSGGVTGRNPGSWAEENSHNVVTGSGATNWVDENKTNPVLSQMNANVGNTNAWNDSSAAAATWNKNQLKVPTGSAVGVGSSGGWGASVVNDPDMNADWGGGGHNNIINKQQQQKLGGVAGLNIDLIKQSKQYRILVESGFKKEEVERALLNANMNIEEAADILRNNANIVMDGWRRHDEVLGNSYADHNAGGGGNSAGVGGVGFPGRYPNASNQPSMAFPPNNLLNNIGGNAVGAGSTNPNLAALSSIQPLQQVQKYLGQGPHNVNVAGGGIGGGPPSVNAAAAVAFGQAAANVSAGNVNATPNTNNQPSPHQLRMLVQQIQMAVHSGYLSSQILNQPLAPATLLLLNQLLSNIKHLQGAQQSLTRGNNVNNLQLNVAIAKYKQQIQNLQNQINAQQSIYIKQQQQQQQQQQQSMQPQTPQQHPAAAHASAVSNNEYLRGQHDAITALQGNFTEMNLNKPGVYQGAPNQQSRLNQWKLPVLDKDVASDSTDFSRAPGASKQNLATGVNPNNMGPLGLQSDGTWSTGRTLGDGWPDPSNDNENKDWSSVAQPSSVTYTDFVQEFEPGKPWKGSQIKTIEDDPSITPGSVARSPLSIDPTPKEADMFSNTSKNSQTDTTPLSLSSSTWSFNPSGNNQNFPNWSDNSSQCATSELWSNPMNKTSRGPPPGLGSNKGGGIGTVPGVGGVTVNCSAVVNNSSNGWLGGGGGGRGLSNSNSAWTGGVNTNWNSNWLLLKNLTAQNDGSTLRTLCMQHGPILSFHLYLAQGIALCKYATREEASKAQISLNNCGLGHTTICAESPNENEVQNLLQRLPQQQQAPNGNGNSGGGTVGSIAAVSSAGNTSNNSGGLGGGVSTVASGSVVNGANVGNTGSNTAANTGAQGQSSSTGAGNGSNVQGGSGGGGSSAGANNAGNSASNNGGGTGNPNNHSSNNNANNAAAWRQTQNQQNQTRPAGRETDFDYISKYVCSIVDD